MAASPSPRSARLRLAFSASSQAIRRASSSVTQSPQSMSASLGPNLVVGCDSDPGV